MSNLWRKFSDLLPSDPLFVGTITANYSDGTVLVEFLDGGTLRVLGTGSVNDVVYVQSGRTVGDAPTLSISDIEV